MFFIGIVGYAILILAYIAYGEYCARQNRSVFFSANVNANVIENVAGRVAKNVARNATERKAHA